jgi:hypothetical protein
MTDQTNTTASGDPGSRGELPWDDVEARLVAALERMALDQYLILSTRPAGDDESLYFVQFAQAGRAGFLAEAVSNRYLAGAAQLSPAQEDAMAGLGWQFPDHHATKPKNFSRQWPIPAPFVDVARLAVRTLREVYGVERPADLAYRRFARDGHDFAEPGLGIDAERPTSPRGKGQATAPTVAELTPLVEAALCGFLGIGSIALTHRATIRSRPGPRCCSSESCRSSRRSSVSSPRCSAGWPRHPSCWWRSTTSTPSCSSAACSSSTAR